MRVDEEGVMVLIRQGYNVEQFDLELPVRAITDAEDVESTKSDPGSNGRFLRSPLQEPEFVPLLPYGDVTLIMINDHIRSSESESEVLTPPNRPHSNTTTALCKIFSLIKIITRRIANGYQMTVSSPMTMIQSRGGDERRRSLPLSLLETTEDIKSNTIKGHQTMIPSPLVTVQATKDFCDSIRRRYNQRMTNTEMSVQSTKDLCDSIIKRCDIRRQRGSSGTKRGSRNIDQHTNRHCDSSPDMMEDKNDVKDSCIRRRYNQRIINREMSVQSTKDLCDSITKRCNIRQQREGVLASGYCDARRAEIDIDIRECISSIRSSRNQRKPYNTYC